MDGSEDGSVRRDHVGIYGRVGYKLGTWTLLSLAVPATLSRCSTRRQKLPTLKPKLIDGWDLLLDFASLAT